MAFRLHARTRFCLSWHDTNGAVALTSFGLVFANSNNLTNYMQQPWLISNLMHKILVYSHIIHLLKSSTCFEHYSVHLQEVYVVYTRMKPVVLSLSAGDCPVHRLR